MRRGIAGPRRGPSLMGTMARTAVIAGTATAVSGATSNAMNKSAQQKQAQSEAAAAAQQAQVDAAAQQAVAQQMAAAQPAAAPAPAAPAGNDLVAQLQQLAALKDAGVLSDAEFETAKAKLLAGG